MKEYLGAPDSNLKKLWDAEARIRELEALLDECKGALCDATIALWKRGIDSSKAEELIARLRAQERG